MSIQIILQVYLAFFVVLLIHEIGHLPKKIKISFKYIIPIASAMQAKSRTGGLMANAALFLIIFFAQPQIYFLQLVGAIAWIHFVIYVIFGSILPEKQASQVNTKTHIFDDVDNKLAHIFIPLGLITLVFLQDYYLPILKTLI